MIYVILRRSRNVSVARKHAAVLSGSAQWGNLWCVWRKQADSDPYWTVDELRSLFPEHDWRQEVLP